MSKLAKRYRSRHKSNPSATDVGGELLEVALPAGLAFGGTRLLTKLGVMLIAKKWPSKAKHGGALAAIGTFVAAWLLAHRWKAISRYHGPIVAGSAIAAAVNLLQLYIPKIGWLFGDPTELTAGAATQNSKAIAAAAQAAQLPAGMEEIDDDPAHYTYNDAYDAGRYKANDSNKAQPSGPNPALEDETWGADNVFAGGLAGN